MTLGDKIGITSDVDNRPGLISRCLKRSGASFRKLFNNIPNLAVDREPAAHDDTAPGDLPTEETRTEYQDLALKLKDGPDWELLNGEKPADVRHLQETVAEIVCRGKEKMASARSQEEIVMAFMADLYKIKSLL
jgi:hypothetical protein